MISMDRPEMQSRPYEFLLQLNYKKISSVTILVPAVPSQVLLQPRLLISYHSDDGPRAKTVSGFNETAVFPFQPHMLGRAGNMLWVYL